MKITSDWTTPATSTIDRYEDGDELTYRWWDAPGTIHDLIHGGPGTGKSTLCSLLVEASGGAGCLITNWVADPTDIASFATAARTADSFVPIVEMLQAVAATVAARAEVVGDHCEAWVPTTGMPLLVVTLVDADSYPEALAYVDVPMRMARKCGVKLRVVQHRPPNAGTLWGQEIAGRGHVFALAPRR